MTERIRLFKSKWKYSENEYWVEFYPKRSNLRVTLDKWGYFDSRPLLSFQLTTVLAVAFLLTLGLSWISVLLVIPFFLFPWGKIYIMLPYDTGKDDECESPSYGFYFYSDFGKIPDSLWIRLGRKSKVIYMPWSLDLVRTSILLKDDTWEHEIKGNRKEFYLNEWKDKQMSWNYDYTDNYDGEIIPTTIYLEEREWRPKWFRWTKLFRKVRTAISVQFSKEVGKEKGSWKGGCLGCGYELLPGEQPLDCLKRMEKERKF